MAKAMSEDLMMEKLKLKDHLVLRPILFGILGGALLLVFYFGIVSWAANFRHAVDELLTLWYWILALVAGFGVQVGLFSYVRGYAKVASARSSIAASGGLSTLSMAACCAHHVTDFMPLLGLSAAALFLTKYQTVFLTVGVVSNLIGINVMLLVIQKHGLYHKRGSLLGPFMRLNLKGAFCVLMLVGAAAVGATFYLR